MSNTEENSSRIYIINLRKAWLTPKYRRTDRVVNIIREFAQKHMKTKEVKIDQDLNRQIWSRGKTNPPRRVRVKIVRDEDETAIVSRYEEAQKKIPSPPAEESSSEPESSNE